jgi:hypothetical protein
MSLMQTIDTLKPPKGTAQEVKTLARGFWSRADAFLERLGDRINPILVKESRQALKSKQFTITFGLLLLCGWGWSLIACGLMAERLDYGGAAIPTFIGYFIILEFPVLVIVPFAAFLSLVAERDEGTYELLSITSLSAGQIVRGKLGSALLQMLVYFAAIAPCIVFTYMLRGLDIITIGFVLIHTFFASIVLSAFGLLLATLTRAVHARVLLAGIYIIALAIAAFMWMMFVANVAFLCAMLSFLVLFTSAAAAQISFASDNRSTRVRRIMFVQQTLFIGWTAYFISSYPFEEAPFYIAATLAGIYWVITGGLMTGELAELSPRVQRDLPRTALGRILLTWFNPGSGTGYVFAVANLAVTILTMGIVGHFVTGIDLSDWWLYGLAVLAYVTIYLGVGRLIILVARRYARFGAVVGLLIQAVVAGLGGLIPATLQLSFYRIFGDDYTFLQIPNWIWTLAELMDNGMYRYTNIDGVTTVIILGIVATPLLIANLAVAAREVAATRIAAPQRVIEEETQRA